MSIYQFIGPGAPTDKEKILLYPCHACQDTNRKKKSFRAQIEIVSNLSNHMSTVHAEDDFYKAFLEEQA